jgi:hypothetical protein
MKLHIGYDTTVPTKMEFYIVKPNGANKAVK